MKKILSFIFTAIFILLFVFQATVFAAQAETFSARNNNTSFTVTSFNVYEGGRAIVHVKYSGYAGITTGAKISITIKKNTFLWFYSTVVDETYNIVGEDYSESYYYDLSDSGSGTYKCNVTYTISGNGGADDVIPFEDKQSY